MRELPITWIWKTQAAANILDLDLAKHPVTDLPAL